jgi:alpha-methylacyl-CoA racemase
VSALLAGVRVLDLSTVGPGSRCSAMLADYGADVVKVARPAGAGGTEPPWFAYGAGRGTRILRLDLKDDAGRATFLELAADAQVVIESYRPGVAERLGIGYRDVRAVNAGIVYASLTGYGQDGPYAGWAGHDLNYLAMGGFLATQGRRGDGGPALPGATVADSAGGGMHAALSIVAALHHGQRTGEGVHLDVAATDGVLSLMSLHLDEHLATGVEPAPGSGLLTGRYACYDVYEAADGRWLAVGAIEGKFFANLCRLLGRPELAGWQYDEDRQDELRAALATAFAARPRDDWVVMLAGADTCVTPVLAVSEVVRDPHLIGRGAFGEVEHADHGLARQVAPVLAGTCPPAAPATAPPPELAP